MQIANLSRRHPSARVPSALLRVCDRAGERWKTRKGEGVFWQDHQNFLTGDRDKGGKFSKCFVRNPNY